jgi:hypothetical protein
VSAFAAVGPDESARWLRGACSSGDPLHAALRVVLDDRAARDTEIIELVDAWTEVITINRFARENGGKAHRRLWTAIDAIAESRGSKP